MMGVLVVIWFYFYFFKRDSLKQYMREKEAEIIEKEQKRQLRKKEVTQ
jgi:hypothetical protein